MRIAYSCAGEGFGHAARMVALYPDLAGRHRIDLFVPSSIEGFVRARLPGAAIGSIPHFGLEKRGNRIAYGATAISALRLAGTVPATVVRLARRLLRRGVDVALSDFDPFLPFAARLAGIPVVQMNHPGIVLKYLDADPRGWAAALSAGLMEGPWDERLIVSFYGGDVGPVLRKSLYRHLIRDEGFLAVNVKEEVRSRVVPMLDSVPGLRYRLYPSPGADFDEGLAACSAVVAGAGHQTISEALCLGKPVLALPQEGQYEQLLNARMLERTGPRNLLQREDLPGLFPLPVPASRIPLSPVLSAEFCLRDSRMPCLPGLEECFRTLGESTGERPLPKRTTR
jgi:hypothetical protein